MGSNTVKVVLLLLAELFIAMGTAVTSAMIQNKEYVLPGMAVWLFGGLMGFVAAWAEVKQLLKGTVTL